MDSSCLTAPELFPFPFPPYDIQEEFMKHLYQVLKGGGVGIFESPTGTGKSMSLICGSLTWLKDYEEKKQEEMTKVLSPEQSNDHNVPKQQDTKETASEPDWVQEFAEQKAKREVRDRAKEEQARLLKQKLKLQEIRNQTRPGFAVKGKRKHSDNISTEEDKNEAKIKGEIEDILGKRKPEDPDADIVVADYHSEDEETKDSGSDEEQEEEPHCMKIYYCSRTHSQLAQFVREVQKSPFSDDTRVTSLGSRQNLCVNGDVKKLKSIKRINDRCLELQKNKKKEKRKDGEKPVKRKKAASGCPFLDHKQLQTFKDHALVDVKEIEQLVALGEKLKACPYYGTRLTIPSTQLVVLPYNLLLHKATREACGIKLAGNVVIIDEAHNLIDTISSIHSVEITGTQISASFSQLSQYLDKYRSRFKAKNLMYIRQLLFILSSFMNCLGGKSKGPKSSTLPQEELAGQKTPAIRHKTEVKLQTINDFLFSVQLDNMNLFKVQRYCEHSMISKKLNGFVDKYQQESVRSEGSHEACSMETTYQAVSPLQHIENFLGALTNADKDGRIVVNKQERSSMSSLKFLLLNPGVHFKSLVQESHAVIVAGGTMQPTSDFKEQLFTCVGLPTENIKEFSCGHVIPPEHLLAVALDKGPSGMELDFTYQSRDSTRLMEDVGRLLVNLCAVIPGGVVCFFSSYDYESKIYAHWEKCGILERLNTRKKVFREPRKSSRVDEVLSAYTACIKRSGLSSSECSSHVTGKPPLGGAVLLSVVGGKMSEGINFSDDLGRCIVMVGLPYPNINSPELKEKMAYLDSTLGSSSGNAHYENLCMKAVNQSIGRAIRHKNDYASILLLDHRYGGAKVRNKLPAWIKQRLQHHTRFGVAFAAIRKFFVDKRAVDRKDSSESSSS